MVRVRRTIFPVDTVGVDQETRILAYSQINRSLEQFTTSLQHWAVYVQNSTIYNITLCSAGPLQTFADMLDSEACNSDFFLWHFWGKLMFGWSIIWISRVVPRYPRTRSTLYWTPRTKIHVRLGFRLPDHPLMFNRSDTKQLFCFQG